MKTTSWEATAILLTLALQGCDGGPPVNNNNNTRPCDATIDTSTMQFVSGSATIDEDGGSVEVAVMRVGGCTGAVTLMYELSGTASAGSDYIAAEGELTWEDQDTVDKSFTITVVNDQEIEGDETIEISLAILLFGEPVDATIGQPATMVITIFDDEISGPPPFLVKDIRTVGNAGSEPGQGLPAFRGAIADGRYYFTADDGLSGLDLWRSDGTAAGTEQVVDFQTGSVGSNPFRALTTVGSNLYFVAYDTETSNSYLYEVSPGVAGAARVRPEPFDVARMAAVGNQLLIVTFADELWVSDGTAGGTVMLHSFSDAPTELTTMGSNLYFAADALGNGVELWTSDGTAAGTVPVLDLAPGDANSSPQNLAVVGNQLFFDADDGSGIGREPYISDGTEAGTTLIGDISPGADSTALNGNLAIGDTLYFAHETSAEGLELWKTDGTQGGTVLVKDATPNASGSSPTNLTAVGTTLFFDTRGAGGVALWKSDGSDAGTVEVAVIDSSTSPFAFGPSYLTAMDGILYFEAPTDTNDWELWRSDGTAAGTIVLKERTGDEGTTPNRLSPRGLIVLNGTLLFTADDGTHGAELWSSDGTEAGTDMLVDINQVPLGSNAGNFVTVGSTLYFGADDGVSGYQVWLSDGTTDGTQRLGDIAAGRLTPVGSELFMFMSTAPTPGYQIWKTDGTTAGTVWVSDVGSPDGFTASTDTMLFFGARGAGGAKLWRSDGTDAGTVLVRDDQLNEFGPPTWMVGIGSTLYFGAGTVTSGSELWKTDGTDAGTVMVKEIAAGTNDSDPSKFTPHGGLLYFVATNDSDTLGVWKSDGTDAGTTEVKAGWPSGSFDPPSYLTGVGSTLYFVADNLDPVDGRTGLWKSDGTNSGTVLVRDLPYYDAPRNLTAVGDTLYFVAGNEDEDANALWISDGTEAGTVVLKDMLPANSRDVYPSSLTAVEDILVFSVDDGVTGDELWRSDGTELGTHRVADFNLGPASFSPSGLTEINGTVYFRGTTTTVGDELFGYTP